MKEIRKMVNVYRKDGDVFWATVDRKKLTEVCEKMRHEYGITRVISISGNDTGKVIEVIYHFEIGHGVLNLKTEVSKRSNTVDSITPIFPSANLYERELAEMLGIKVKGHPNLKKLFLPKDINQPLRKGD